MDGPLVAIGPDALDLDALIRQVSSPFSAGASASGAVVTFLGIVRGESRGRRVQWLEYEAYDALALETFRRIHDEAVARWPSLALAFRHRTGRLEAGQASVAIAAASPHRAEAFAACRYVIERLKQIAPIWKHESYEDGDEWLEGATANPDDDAAREEAMRRSCG